MTILAFVDTETTALGHLARPWEIAIVKRNTEDPGLPDGEWIYHVDYTPDSLPDGTQRQSLEVGRWRERSGLRGADYRERVYHQEGVLPAAGPEWTIAQSVHEQLAGVVLVGAGAHFDAAVLSRMFRRHGLSEEPWHYAILDIKAMAYGHAIASGLRPTLPLQSDQLVQQTDGPTTSQEERHTALGDARWVAAWWSHLHKTPTSAPRGTHEFKAPPSQVACGAMVMRGGQVDECGLPLANAVHRQTDASGAVFPVL